MHFYPKCNICGLVPKATWSPYGAQRGYWLITMEYSLWWEKFINGKHFKSTQIFEGEAKRQLDHFVAPL